MTLQKDGADFLKLDPDSIGVAESVATIKVAYKLGFQWCAWLPPVTLQKSDFLGDNVWCVWYAWVSMSPSEYMGAVKGGRLGHMTPIWILKKC